MVIHQLRVKCRPGKVRRSKTDVLPLIYANQLDSHLIVAVQVSAFCIFQLRQLLPVLRSLSTDAAKTLVQTFIAITRLDYCNALLYGITDNLFRLLQLQAVQTTAAQLVTDVRRSEHITPVFIYFIYLWINSCRKMTIKYRQGIHKSKCNCKTSRNFADRCLHYKH